ncbi:DUF262 domain-containing protein [Nocardioides sp. GY 10113]|uniref:DUF262 domain-containing protein n=1 Tax=Nocardioides sp. GY 10113 TaxID=2569761 RepID=UPI0010A8C1F8|nr:DUF262 domain-containing protein [Nocardioides sp. GY 10113]TIC79892.1 DUF262 domain-containing protein [Nocardioides sp. GY 10113]
MLHGAASVDAFSMKVGDVLGERYPFAVPRYQRAYAWDDQAIDYFVRDIESLLDQPAGETSHFFGGVVCIQLTDNQRNRPTSYEVVDGQQRLATLMLALSCVVEVAGELAERSKARNKQVAKRARTLEEDTRDNFVTWKESDVAAGSTMIRPRMKLSLADDDVFQALVMSAPVPAPTRESHRLLIEARGALLGMTRAYVGTSGPLNNRVDRLLRLRQALVQDAHVIHIVSKDRRQAYRLFSVLNHRGESLSDADLLRSRSLELLDGYPEEHEEVAAHWDEMLAAPAADVEDFFRALYPSVTGQRARGDLFEATAERFFPEAPPSKQTDARELVETIEWLRDELVVFLKLLDGEWPFERKAGKPTKVRAWQVDRLRRLVITLKHELALPVLLAGARSLDEATFADMVYMLELFAFRYKNVCNGHATRPANVYYAQAKAMREATKKSPYALKPFRVALGGLITKHAGDSIFKQLLVENLRYSNASQRANIREFLTTLEDHRSWWLKTGAKDKAAKPKPKMTKVIDIEDATLEHIYPQSPSAADKDPALEPLKHTLGNLTFFGSTDNVAAENKPFSAKRKLYYEPSEIAMTADLAKKTSWGKSDVTDRQKDLLDQAVRIFMV